MLVLVGGLAGCVSNNKGPMTTNLQRFTVGQELIDLKKAHDAGAVTDEEYEHVKSQLMDVNEVKIDCE